MQTNNVQEVYQVQRLYSHWMEMHDVTNLDNL